MVKCRTADSAVLHLKIGLVWSYFLLILDLEKLN